MLKLSGTGAGTGTRYKMG